MWYQRIEVEREPPIQTQLAECAHTKNFTGKRKRQAESETEDEPANFCRVRMNICKSDLTQCKHCKKNIISVYAESHPPVCLQNKERVIIKKRKKKATMSNLPFSQSKFDERPCQ